MCSSADSRMCAVAKKRGRKKNSKVDYEKHRLADQPTWQVTCNPDELSLRSDRPAAPIVTAADHHTERSTIQTLLHLGQEPVEVIDEDLEELSDDDELVGVDGWQGGDFGGSSQKQLWLNWFKNRDLLGISFQRYQQFPTANRWKLKPVRFCHPFLRKKSRKSFNN